MPVNNDQIKAALDDFEADDFMSAKDRIKGEIHGAVHDYFKTKLGLQRDIEPQNVDTGTDTGNVGDASGTD